jgi:hypothetical protein
MPGETGRNHRAELKPILKRNKSQRYFNYKAKLRLAGTAGDPISTGTANRRNFSRKLSF